MTFETSLDNEALLKYAEEMPDTDDKSSSIMDKSYGITNLKQETKNIKNQNDEANKFMEMYKARQNLEENQKSYLDNSELEERLVIIQKEINDLVEEKRRLENEKFSSLLGISTLMASSAPSSPQRSTMIQSILKNPKPKQPQNISNISERNGDSFSDFPESPIQATAATRLKNELEEEKKQKFLICAQFKAFIDLISQRYQDEIDQYQNIKESLDKIQDSSENSRKQLKRIENNLNAIKKLPVVQKQSLQNEVNDNQKVIQVLSNACQNMASSVFKALDVDDNQDVLTNVDQVNALEMKVRAVLRAKIPSATQNPQLYSKETKQTISDVTNLMKSLENRLQTLHQNIFYE